MAGVSSPYFLLKEEFVQRADEGCVIPEPLRTRFQELDPVRDEWHEAALAPIEDALRSLHEDPLLAAAEPHDLASIRALRPPGKRCWAWKPSPAELQDRLHGAWVLRAAGCTLGKPVEILALQRDTAGRLCGRRDLRDYLERRQSWPLRDYFPLTSASGGVEIPAWTQPACRGHVDGAPEDDDLMYTFIGLRVLENHGADFTWQDVARFWLNEYPATRFCTAEGQALFNFQLFSRAGQAVRCTAAECATHRNPYREWIGAQIRSDGWAWACAGNPERAAEFAWRDASWTHSRNGIYGAMFFAAMQAAAFVEQDVGRLIEIGLSEIPADCRLARWVRRAREVWFPTCPDWESCMDRLEEELQTMHAVHTINNALVCLIALHYAGLDPLCAPATAVACGLDTDCNGATVGSICGAAHGRAALPEAFVGPLQDRYRAQVYGRPLLEFTELAERHARVWQRLHA